jgi:hypothetical protein
MSVDALMQGATNQAAMLAAAVIDEHTTHVSQRVRPAPRVSSYHHHRVTTYRLFTTIAICQCSVSVAMSCVSSSHANSIDEAQPACLLNTIVLWSWPVLNCTWYGMCACIRNRLYLSVAQSTIMNVSPQSVVLLRWRQMPAGIVVWAHDAQGHGLSDAPYGLRGYAVSVSSLVDDLELVLERAAAAHAGK